MQFVYHKSSGEDSIILEGESFIHLYRSRRGKREEILNFRNLKDNKLHRYKNIEMSKNHAKLEFVESIEDGGFKPKDTHIIWAIVEPKVIEKTLPFLNELGVKKLTLFFSEFSQKNQKIDSSRLERILISSCEQCGRGELMEIELIKNIDEVIDRYRDSLVFVFGGKEISSEVSFSDGVMIGAEGGFSKGEREKLRGRKTYSIKNGAILKSQTAVITLASIALLNH